MKSNEKSAGFGQIRLQILKKCIIMYMEKPEKRGRTFRLQGGQLSFEMMKSHAPLFCEQKNRRKIHV